MLPLAVHIPFLDQSVILCGIPVVAVVFYVIVAYFVSDALSAIPTDYRRDMTPGQVWLLVIPIFGLVWNFFVFQRVSLSFQSYFEANGRPIPGDYSKQMGLVYSIVSACCIVPCVGSLAAIAAFVLAILLIVKFQEYKKMIISGGGGAFPVDQPIPPQK